MPLIALKVLLAPLLIATCTLAAHRWGEAVGGWLVGLPLISGPVSVLLFLEHGPNFARVAARGTLLGLIAAAAFYTCYVLIANRQPWWRSLLAAYAACIVTAFSLTKIHPDLVWSVALALGVLGGLAWRMDAPRIAVPRAVPSVSRLMARMAIAGSAVYLVTAFAGVLGASVAGMLAPLPVVAAIMAVSSQRSGEREAAREMLRGTLAGSWGGAAFFAVVGVMMGLAGPTATYVVATCAALAGAAAAMRVRGREACVQNPSHLECRSVNRLATPPSTATARFACRPQVSLM